MPTTRQETRRAATRHEILDTARAQIAEHGAAALSLRAIARQMQLTAPALYRYFNDRDELVTALIVEAFNALADAMAAAGQARSGARLADQLLAMCLAYRDWALVHPQDYLLIFGTPIPGYNAPAEITAPAAKRCFDVIVAALATQKRGLRLGPGYSRTPAGLQAQVEAWRARYGYQVGSAALLYALVAWTRIHGLVSLELVGQIEPFFGQAGELYRLEMVKLIREAGLSLSQSGPKRGHVHD